MKQTARPHAPPAQREPAARSHAAVADGPAQAAGEAVLGLRADSASSASASAPRLAAPMIQDVTEAVQHSPRALAQRRRIGAIDDSPRVGTHQSFGAGVQRSPRVAAHPTASRTPPTADVVRPAAADVVQRQIARGSGWGWPWWAPGGRDAWEALEANFPGFMALMAELDGLVDTHGPLTPQHEAARQGFAAVRRHDTVPISYADGLQLHQDLPALVKSARDLRDAIKKHHTDQLAEQRSAVDEVGERLSALAAQLVGRQLPGVLKTTTQGTEKQRDAASAKAIRAALEAVEEQQELLKPLGKLLNRKDQPARLGDDDLATLDGVRTQAAALDKQWASAFAEAGGRESLVDDLVEESRGDNKALNKAWELKQRDQWSTAVEAWGATAEQVQALRTAGFTGDELKKTLPYASPAELDGLLDKADRSTLAELLPRTGKGKAAVVGELLDAVTVAGHATLVELVDLAGGGGLATLKTILGLFGAGAGPAVNALALLRKVGKGQVALAHALLTRHGLGVGNAPDLIICLDRMSASRLLNCLDPAIGNHSLAQMKADLQAGYGVWAGEGGGAPAYRQLNGEGKLVGSTLAHVRGHAHDTQALGMPAANGQVYCSRPFGNHGGPDAMRLPRGVAYTEYDIRPFTGEADRGLIRIVVGGGHVYHTTDHYQSFRRV